MTDFGDMQGRTVVVTGASDGIGAAAARTLHELGATVVVVGRSAAKTHGVADELHADRFVVDYARMDEVRELADRLLAGYPCIDVLINNAGLIAGARTLTGDGHELTFQVNHLAPFLLTGLLRDRLIESRGRVVVTASRASTTRKAVVVLDDLDSRRSYSALRAYATTKLENILFTRELARRWGPSGVTVAAAHPGMVRSRFGAHSTAPVRLVMGSPLRRLMRSPERGADTIVWLATARPGVDWRSGGYYADRRPARPPARAADASLGRQLWERSAQLVRLPDER